jgi:phosphopantothenoylcysteine decarboxylase/phosphopantothenate--cysteine ligase
MCLVVFRGVLERRVDGLVENKPDNSLEGYEVLLAVTGGIACYKSADLASKLVQAGCGLNVAMTEAAMEFIRPLTFQSITNRSIYTSMWQSTEYYQSSHISLTQRADLLIIAPATANIIAKMAVGIADDLVSTMILAANGECPILLAPAMNTRMWEAPVVQANVEKLRQWGTHIIGPVSGRLACGTVGPGRMSEPADILQAATKILLKNDPKKHR